MDTLYKCINGFTVEKYDDYGFAIDGEYLEIEEGSIWSTDGDNCRVIDGEIRLISTKENVWEWLEISKETLKENFELLV